MENYRKNKLSWFTICCVFCIPVLTSQAGIMGGLSELVEPGGVEIPAIVNVLGPEKPNDINDVKEIFKTANDILKQANIQFNIKWINPGVTLVGDGDGNLSENEFNEVLYRSVFELSGLSLDEDDLNDTDAGSIWWNRSRGLGKGMKFNIADDVWVEQPERVFWHDIFYPVAFLESSVPPEQLGRILAQNIGFSAGLSPSTDPANLLHLDGQGTEIKEDQINWFLGLGRQVGHVRSHLAEGYSSDILADLHLKWSGALFESEGFVLRGDYREDVIIEDVGGSQIGSSLVDLEAFIAKSGRIPANDQERELVLKYYLASDELPEDIYFDTYFRVPSHHHGDNGNGSPIGLPWETFDAVIGTGVTSSGSFVGVTNLLLGDSLWVELPGIQPEVSHDLGRTKVRIGIPFLELTPHLPEDILECLNDNRGLEIHVTANRFSIDSVGGFRFEDDSIENFKLKSNPRLISQITSEFRIEDIDVTTLAFGWDVSSTILEEDFNDLDKHDIGNLLDQPVSGVLAGRVVVPWLNFNTDGNNDSFNSTNGFPNNLYPGIDLSDSNNLKIVTEARSLMHIPTGLHVFGLQGKDTGILNIGPVKVGWLTHPNHEIQDGINDGSNSEPVNGSPPFKGNHEGNFLNVLKPGDAVIDIKETGLYQVSVRWFSQIRADLSDEPNDPNDPNGPLQASLELLHVLPDGTKTLLGDATNGSFTAYVPPEGFDIPDVPDVPDGSFEGFETGIIDTSLWTFRGDADWFASTEQAHSGSYSAQSGSIGDDESSTLSLFRILEAAGEISFWRKVSSEEGFDFLRFSLNGEVLGEWSGEQDWEQVFFPSRRGPNTFELTYIKDSSSDSGHDGAWIDDLLILP